MKLSNNEMKFLAPALGELSVLSPFATTGGEVTGGESETLAKKGVLAGGQYSGDALVLLPLLAKAEKAACVNLRSRLFRMERYTYLCGGRLIAAVSTEDDDAEFVEIGDAEDLAFPYISFVGASDIFTSSVRMELSPAEMLVLTAIIDLYRKDGLLRYAGADQAIKSSFSRGEILSEIAGDYPNGIASVLRRNLNIPRPDESETEAAVKTLVSKGIFSEPGELAFEYEYLARLFLTFEFEAKIDRYDLDGDTLTVAQMLCVGAGLREILAFLWGEGKITVMTISGRHLLGIIRDTLGFGRIGPSSAPPPPVSAQTPPVVMQPAPAPVPQPAAPPASVTVPKPASISRPPVSAAAGGGWTCPACGEINTGKFCKKDGTPRPEGSTAVPAPAAGGGKHCSACGSAVPAGAKFCKGCGAKM